MKSIFAALFLTLVGNFAQAATDLLTIKDGDHIAILGNALADRMQHGGWLETLLQAQFPERHLSVRNLGFAGDELAVRMRCENFGSPDDWLKRTKADVILAFFGYNESFAGPSGVGKFKQELDKFISNSLEHKYNEQSPPRLVLFSPIAQENKHAPNLPDGAPQNNNLKLYTDLMAEVAKQRGVPFVDLFTPSLKMFSETPKSLTIDTVHLTDEGNHLLAPLIIHAVFPTAVTARHETASLGKIRAAVLDKNFYWFNRYRTVDGY